MESGFFFSTEYILSPHNDSYQCLFYRFSSSIHFMPVSLWFSNCMRLCVCVYAWMEWTWSVYVCMSTFQLIPYYVNVYTHSCTYAHTYAHTPPAPPTTPIWGPWTNRAKNGDCRFSVLTVTCDNACFLSLSATLHPPFLSYLSPLSYLFPFCRT